MISVVIPTCNRSDYLKASVEAVLNQSYLPIEIILINNGDTKIDDSVTTLSSLIKVVDIMPFAGVAQARNFGVILACSEYIAFLDDDDLWECEYIEKVQKIISEKKPDGIISRVDQLIKDKITSFKSSSDYPNLSDVLKFNPGYVGSSIIIKRTTFLKVGGFDVKLVTSEDKSLIIEMMKNNCIIIHSSHIQCILRQHDGVRLSNHSSMSQGVELFYNKYKNLMTFEIKSYNLYKLFLYKWKNRKNILFLFLYLINGFNYIVLKKFRKDNIESI